MFLSDDSYLQSLQLLEYIVKHGSERVVDDARSHLGTIKILRNFHYIDEAGKDQGLNGECQLASNGKVHKCSFKVCSKTDATYCPNVI